MRKTIEPWKLLAEGVAIVLSILLAFAIDAWWDDHQDRAAEAAALRSLAIEFADNLEQLATERRSHAASLAATLQLLGMTGPDQPDLADISVIAPLLVSCLSNANFEPRLGALNSLVASGRLHLIQDEPLQRMLTEWPSTAQDLVDWERIERENTEQLMLPFTYDYVAYPDVMLAIGALESGAVSDGNVLSKLYPDYVGSRFESDFAGLFASIRFEGMLNNRIVNLRMLIERIEALETSTREILDRLSSAES